VDFRSRFPSRLWRPSVDDEVDGELEFHLEMRTREYMERGMPRAQAREAALRKFGDFRRARRECRALGRQRERQMRIVEYFSELRQDAAFSIRQMLAVPAFTLVAVVTLAIGIGATTAIFSAVNAVVLRPLPVPEPDRLVVVSSTWRQFQDGALSAGNYVDIADEQQAFATMTAVEFSGFALAQREGADRVLGAKVTGRFFDVFGIRPALGRVFGEAEDQPGRDQVVVLSHRLWTRQFASDPDIVGREITMNMRPYTVIGVMPSQFDFTSDAEELWVPIAFSPERRAMHDEHYLQVIARLRPGVTIEQANRQLGALGKRQQERFPRDNAERGFAARPLLEVLVGDYRSRLLLLLGSVGFVLLIACGNVANLLLARGTARVRELALRSALGAGQGRLVRQLVTESVVLGVVAAVAGLALAAWLIKLLIAYSPPGVPRLEQARIDGVVLAFSAGIALLSSLVFGIIPAWRASHADVNANLKNARGTGARATKDWVRFTLIGAEVALALVLLVGAGLLIRTNIAMQRVDPGFEPSGVFTARVALPQTKYSDPGLLFRTFTEIADQVSALPGVTAAAVTTTVPSAGGFSNGLLAEERGADFAHLVQSMARFVSPGYFKAMGVRIERGRGFTDADRLDAPDVIIVNEAIARTMWPGQDPLGRRIRCCRVNPDDIPVLLTVIGVATDVSAEGPAQPVQPEFYLPIAQLSKVEWGWTNGNMFVVARTAGDPMAVAPSVRRVVAGIDPGVPVFQERTMEQRMASTIATARFNTFLLSILGGIGLLLSAVGIYGVIAYFVSQRTSEIGVRVALGATRRDVMRMIVWQAAKPVLVGVAVGLLGSFFAVQLIATQLVGVPATDPVTLGFVVAALLIVSVMASLIPARRAAALDPTKALQTA
jgi:predicted permease